MTWSILIATVPSRKKQVQKLLAKLEKQTQGYDDIQILCLYDNKSVTTGMKRNLLLRSASSAYISFIDDDDNVADDYVAKIYPLLKPYTLDRVSFNIRYVDDVGADKVYDFTEYPPTHAHVWKRENIAHEFDDIMNGEDRQWMLVNDQHFGNTHHIPEVLYIYQFNTKGTETQK